MRRAAKAQPAHIPAQPTPSGAAAPGSYTGQNAGISFEVPMNTQGGDNRRECWQAKHRRQRAEKEMVGTVCASYRPTEGASLRQVLREMAERGPLDVRVCRLYTGTRPCDPHNLGSRLKGIIDGLALVFGIDDGNTARVRYIPDQERAKLPGVRVEVSARKPEVQGPGWTAEEWRKVAALLYRHGEAPGCGFDVEVRRILQARMRPSEAIRMAKACEAMARALGGGG